MKTIVRALSDRSSHWRLRDPLCWLKRGRNLIQTRQSRLARSLPRKCRALAIKALPTEQAGREAYAQAQRDHFQDCIAKGGNMPD